MDDDLFKVQQKNSSEFYEVNVTVGYCSCPVGKYGAFCKHQAAVYNLYHHKIPNLPPICHETRYLLAKLAFGDEAQANEFYFPLIPNPTENVKIIQESNPINTDNNMYCDLFDVKKNNTVNQINSKETDVNESKTLTEEYKEQIVNLMTDNLKKFPAPSFHVLSKCVQRLKNVKSLTGWENFIATAGNSISLGHRSRATISVQPTTISRRRPGITKGSKRLPVGRPKKEMKKKVFKRNRNLQHNVNKNIPNSKSHGSNH